RASGGVPALTSRPPKWWGESCGAWGPDGPRRGWTARYPGKVSLWKYATEGAGAAQRRSVSLSNSLKPAKDAMRRLAVGLFFAAVPIGAQVQPIADSAAAARKAAQWEVLGRLAQRGIAAANTPEDRCLFFFDGVLAATRLWRFASAPRQLSA